MMKPGLHWEFENTDDHRAGNIAVNLRDRLNTCGVVSPRFDVQLKDLSKWQKNLFPSHPVWFHCPENFSWHHGP
ncbi:unnamed protein product [Gulo gulo]|uniref:40S ribosomal protein S15a n=1 Tax=Gulo gulo TaxID=48420 RepID=A0A9X9QAW3_GULGU|nr:unnamed protein product [Gulo gulo]